MSKSSRRLGYVDRYKSRKEDKTGFEDTYKNDNNVLAVGFGSLWKLNEDQEFEIAVDTCKAVLVKESKFNTLMRIIDSRNHVILELVVSPEIQLTYDKANASMIWPVNIDGLVKLISFTFTNHDDEKLFKTMYAIKSFEASAKTDFSKTIKDEDKKWVTDGYENSMNDDGEEDLDDLDFDALSLNDREYMSDFDGTQKQERPQSSKVPEGRASGMFSYLSSWFQPGDDDGKHDSSSASPDRRSRSDINMHLTAPITRNHAYVARGSKIGVFEVNDKSEMVYKGKIPEVKDSKGELFAPGKLMLHDGDGKVLMLRKDKPDTVYDMDLMTGTIVEEFNALPDKEIANINALHKYDQKTGEKVLMGVNNKSMFTLDMRINSKNRQVNEFSYKTNPGLNCAITTGDGHIAVGSNKGEIRMYTDLGKRAKTLLPGLGESMKAIDVCEDGSWILCTCEQYLLCIPTQMPDNKEKTGFKVRMGKDKPTPLKLQLHPRDLFDYQIQKVCFESAHFNIGENIEEEWIVTSTGEFIITWNFNQIRTTGRTDCYRIKKCSDRVVADQFRYNMDDQVVVALEDDVYLQTRSKKH